MSPAAPPPAADRRGLHFQPSAAAAVLAMLAAAALAAACGGGSRRPPPPPSILVVTMDTTRADAVDATSPAAVMPAFTTLAQRGIRFRQAYAAVPETLPSHTTIMSGLYPAAHGVHENGRTVPASVPLIADRLHAAGYRTSAFVSAFVLARQFGLARGFDVYDDAMPTGRQERPAAETTERALAELGGATTQPRFMWVHYYDPHAPYEPPEPYRSRFAQAPYLGEVAYMDHELGRLAEAFARAAGGHARIVLVADHGEGLGDHGEAQHGTLVYNSTMHVPLAIAGEGIRSVASDASVSTRQVFYTVLDWAGLEHSELSLSASPGHAEAVIGEGMKPFLEYGWQPQVMSVLGAAKAIEAGRREVYDLRSDPAEQHDLGSGANVPAEVQKALDDYPLPSPGSARAPDTLDADAKAKLASLGYISAGAAPAIRKDAPRPADMIGLLPTIERASAVFAAGQYAAAIPLLETIRQRDPGNLDAVLRLAVAHSSLGHRAVAERLFEEARRLAPQSPDVNVYLGLHYARAGDVGRAEPLLEAALQAFPDRVPVLDALADIRARQGRPAEALRLRQREYALAPPSGEDLVSLGGLAMDAGDTSAAIRAFEQARAAQGSAFTHDLELGVLYLDARRFDAARQALDRVPASSPAYPMALFKRAQVAVLLHEPDAAARIALAKKRADAVTRPLIEREKLFTGR
jgi:arylsulfatase A-like enzyme/Tfp pilus assembly protein PilF